MNAETNFDRYLKEQFKDPAFANLFQQANEDWDIALQLSALREKAGLTQADLARKLKTSQQQVSRLESVSYRGHSLRMLRKVAQALGAQVKVVLVPLKARKA